MEHTIEVPYLVEPIVGDGYRAEAFGMSAEAKTSEEAERKLREEIQARLAGGARVATLPLVIEQAEGTQPYMRFAGDLNGDPLLDEWVEAMRNYREQAEADPDYL